MNCCDSWGQCTGADNCPARQRATTSGTPATSATSGTPGMPRAIPINPPPHRRADVDGGNFHLHLQPHADDLMPPTTLGAVLAVVGLVCFICFTAGFFWRLYGDRVIGFLNRHGT